jgi:hypothetical protein
MFFDWTKIYNDRLINTETLEVKLDKPSQTVLAKDNYTNYLFLTKMRHVIAPVGSFRGNFLTLIIKTTLSISNLGFKLTIKKIYQKLRSQLFGKLRAFLKILAIKK